MKIKNTENDLENNLIKNVLKQKKQIQTAPFELDLLTNENNAANIDGTSKR